LKTRWFVPLLLLGGCANLPHGDPLGITAGALQRSQVRAPLVDHHQHLLGTEARRVTLDGNAGWPRERVPLPGDLQRLLSAREAAWNDPSALAALMHDQAVYLDFPGSWAVGRDEVSARLATTFASAYRMRPVASASAGSHAYIAGYYVRGDASETAYVGYFHLDLVATDGGWRILGETPRFPGPRIEPLVDADSLVAMLDEAGIRRALVYSNAYYFSRGDSEQPGEYAQVQGENDWTLDQVRRHPRRLLAACSVNPLRGYAVAEVERCAASQGFQALKLHFNGAGVDLSKPAHAARVRAVYEAANGLRLPVVTHLQSEAGFGAAQVEVFLQQVLPAAPDIPVVVNHLWGGGGYGEEAAAALAVFADAVQRREPAVANLWFDTAQVAMATAEDTDRTRVVDLMRRIGLERILYGSDGPQWGGVAPGQHWRDFARQMPLTEEELAIIATNVVPFLAGAE
jgi:predicted TIM-barrel fold metal-dependent hydrolase